MRGRTDALQYSAAGVGAVERSDVRGSGPDVRRADPGGGGRRYDLALVLGLAADSFTRTAAGRSGDCAEAAGPGVDRIQEERSGCRRALESGSKGGTGRPGPG